MADKDFEFGPFVKKGIGEALEVLFATIGGFLSHFFLTKIVEGKKVVTGVDMEKVRAQAPYFVVSLADEAEFNALVSKLDPGLQKNLEEQMGPIQYGPFLPRVVGFGLGNHQRSDLILTVVQLNERKLPDGTDPRVDTLNMLQQLAEIQDPAEWKRRAVAFKLMRENENDYPGASLPRHVQETFIWLIAEIKEGKGEWDRWANKETRKIRAWTNGMRTYLKNRPRGFFATLRRMYDLPWERSAPGPAPIHVRRPHGRRQR